MSIKKQFLKSRPECKVKLRVTKEQAKGADTIHVVGDFNDWDTTATPMKQLKSGDFTTILYLDLDKDYEFRYMVNGETWMNEPEADRQAETPYPGVMNSVISTHT
ncbi:MAG: isoamylase early set domain-containing protein [Anaerolineae bacterium]